MFFMSGRRNEFLEDLTVKYRDWSDFRSAGSGNYPKLMGAHIDRIKEHFDDEDVIGIAPAISGYGDKAADAVISAGEIEVQRAMLEGFARRMHFGFCRAMGCWTERQGAAGAKSRAEYCYVIFGCLKYMESVRKLLLSFCKAYGKEAFLFIFSRRIYCYKADGLKRSEGEFDGNLESLGKKYADIYRGRRSFADEGMTEPDFEFKRFERYSPIQSGFGNISDAQAFHASFCEMEERGEDMFGSSELSELHSVCAPDRAMIKMYKKYGRTLQDIIYFDTSVLKKNASGLPVNISIDAGIWAKLGYSVRILFQNGYDQRADIYKMVPMSLSEQPEIIPRSKYPYKIAVSESDIAKIKEFVKSNLVYLKRLSDPGDLYDMRDFFDDMIKAD